MPDKLVEVVGRGLVAFPDTMTDAEILEVLRRQHSPEKPGIIESFVNRGIETVKGMGSLALNAAKSATSLEGQATFLPKIAKGMYEGAVDAGAGAIARQFPRGMDNQPEGADFYKSAARGGAAAVPVVGPYVMNKVSDVEDGNWRKVVGETGFDAAATALSGTSPQTVPPALAKMRAVGTNLATDVRDVARSRIWGPALGGTIGGLVGGPVGGAVGFGADLIYSTRHARNAKLAKEAIRVAKAADADSIAAATSEVKILEASEKAAAKKAAEAQKAELDLAKQTRKVEDRVVKADLKRGVGEPAAPVPAPVPSPGPGGSTTAMPSPMATSGLQPAPVSPVTGPLSTSPRTPAPPPRPNLADPAEFKRIMETVKPRGTLAESPRGAPDIASAVERVVEKLHKQGKPTGDIVAAVGGIPEIGPQYATQLVQMTMKGLKLADNPVPTAAAETGLMDALVRSQKGRGSVGETARAWIAQYNASDAGGRARLIRGLGGKLNFEDMRQLAASTDDLR